MCLSVDTKNPEPQGIGQTELQGSVAVTVRVQSTHSGQQAVLN